MTSTSQAKRELVAVASHLNRLGFLVADCGLLSARAGQEIVVTREGVHRARLEPRHLEVVRLDGRSRREIKPSSDLWAHLVVYREREDIGAIVYAQPPFATGFAIAGEGLEEQVLPELVTRLGHVPLIRQESGAQPGDSIQTRFGDSKAVLLANRGVLAVGDDPWDAAARLELVEHFARALLLARLLGRVRTLPETQVARLVESHFAEGGGRNL